MPGKVQAYVEMANETAASITQDAEAWMQFLRHSARFYKYSFNDQLLIYAQRPEATACASYEISCATFLMWLIPENCCIHARLKSGRWKTGIRIP